MVLSKRYAPYSSIQSVPPIFDVITGTSNVFASITVIGQPSRVDGRMNKSHSFNIGMGLDTDLIIVIFLLWFNFSANLLVLKYSGPYPPIMISWVSG